MKLKTLVLAAAVALGLAGLVEARGFFAPPSAERALATASERLSLTPTQQLKLMPLIKRGVDLRAQIRSQSGAAMQADREELARPDADLPAMAAEHQAMVDASLAEARALRDDLLAFYTHELNAQQQAKARIALAKRIDRLDRIRSGLLALGDEPGI